MNPSPPPLALHQLSLYNTGRLTTEQVVAAFSARRPLLDRLLAELAAETPQSRPQHHLIVGQRGMGKTMLLNRIAAELRRDDALRAKFIPLVFAEEQYSVDRLSKFWFNCLDSLADAREGAGDTADANALDHEVERLTALTASHARNDPPLAADAYAAFAKAATRSGQRPVLLVDNLQMVFDRLESDQQHALRELLMRPGAPILIGASPSPPAATQDYGAAFYDHFKVHYLRPLSEDEMRDLLLHLAAAAGRADVRERVLRHPNRLKVLRQLTGGNPRTTLTLFFLYAEDFAPSVFGDLEGLLDRVTPLYKARFEELTDQQQVIVSAAADHWAPIPAATLAERTALPPSTISAQLDRLQKIGVLERVELHGASKAGYQLAERFFNVWFLFRSASRRQRREIEFLTRFLETFYDPPERTRLARSFLSEDRISADRYLLSQALGGTLDNPGLQQELERHAQILALRDEAEADQCRMREVLDLRALPPATLAFDDLRKRLMALVPDGGAMTPSEFAEKVLSSRAMFMNGEREQLASRTAPLTSEELSAVQERIARSHAADVAIYAEKAVTQFSQRLIRGQLRNRHDVEDWQRAFAMTEEKEAIQLMVETLPDGLDVHFDAATYDHIRAALEPDPHASASKWFGWAYILHAKFGRFSEAEQAYREALTRDPHDAMTWNNLGNLLQIHLARYSEAEQAYREAITRNPRNAIPWINLGNLLQLHLARYSEAEQAYREAISRNPHNANLRKCLGYLLQHHLNRFSEAEQAFREAIARNPQDANGWFLLGHLLQRHFGRYSEAEQSYLEAISRDPKFVAPWNGLGNLYADILGRPQEAQNAYEHALSLDPNSEVSLLNQIFLLRDILGDRPAARRALDKVHALPARQFPDTLHLHETLFAAYDANWGVAREALGKALALVQSGLQPANTDDWQRATAVLIHLDYGPALLAFLDEHGHTPRLRPWVEAIRAHAAGDREALLNVAAEVRPTAEKFYDAIEVRLRQLPATTRRRPSPSQTHPKRRRQH